MGGWFLTDDRDEPGKFRIADGTVLTPGGFWLFTEDEFNVGQSGNRPFALSSVGDELFLFSAAPNGDLTGYMHGFDFGAASNGVSFGRHLISTGGDHFVAQSANTLGSANGLPLVGPVVINEVMYHPQDVFVNSAFWNNTEDEFIELHNITDSVVALYDTGAQ